MGEEAGITVFLNPALHFDLGVVSLEQGTRHIRLRTFTVNSTIGDSDPISAPGMFQLPNLKDKLSLRVQAVNASIYEFSYATFGHGGGWNTIGYGAARQISGGFTGVSERKFPAFLLQCVINILKDGRWNLCDWEWEYFNRTGVF